MLAVPVYLKVFLTRCSVFKGVLVELGISLSTVVVHFRVFWSLKPALTAAFPGSQSRRGVAVRGAGGGVGARAAPPRGRVALRGGGRVRVREQHEHPHGRQALQRDCRGDRQDRPQGRDGRALLRTLACLASSLARCSL